MERDAAMFFGLTAKTVEGAGAFSYIVLLLLLIFIGPSFVPTDCHASPSDLSVSFMLKGLETRRIRVQASTAPRFESGFNPGRRRRSKRLLRRKAPQICGAFRRSG